MKNKLLKKSLICFLLVLVLSSLFLFERPIYNLLNHKVALTEQDVNDCEMQIHFIDVGQGDAIAIKLPDGKNMLIDSGTEDSSKQLVNYLNNNYFDNSSNVFDYFLITHSHQDHIGGAKAVFDNFEIKNFYRPFVYCDFETEDPTKYIDTNNIFEKTIIASQSEIDCDTVFFDLDCENIIGEDYVFDFLSPFEMVYNENDYSPIILLTYKNKKIVLTGDAEEYSEEKVIKQNREELENIDILKVGHHGSKTSSSADFVNLLMPKYSIICVGRTNTYGHPTKTVLNRLEGINSKILRTDDNGNIVFGIQNDGEIVYVYDFENRLPVRIQVWQIVIVLSIIGCTIIFIFPKNTKKKLDKIRKKVS